MKKIAVVYSGDSKALNGAALYVNRFKNCEEYFMRKGIFPVVCDNNKISGKAESDAEATLIEKEYADGKIHKIKNRIKRFLSHSYLGNVLYLLLAWEHPGKKTIEMNSERIDESDTVIANDIFSAYYSIKRFPNKPHVFIMHNSGEIFKMLEKKLPHIMSHKSERRLKAIAEEIFRASIYIVFVSQKALKAFSRQYPEYSHKLVYIPVGIIDAEHIDERCIDPISLVCVGTVCERKNQLSILKAIGTIDPSKVSLTIVGGGEKLQDCLDYIERNGLNNVKCTGVVESVVGYLNSATVFIMASLDEGLPAVGVEALRAGLPIMTTDVGGCGELLHDNGIIIENASPEAIAVAINKVLCMKDEIPRWSCNSRKKYEEEFSIEAMVLAYKRMLGERENI